MLAYLSLVPGGQPPAKAAIFTPSHHFGVGSVAEAGVATLKTRIADAVASSAIRNLAFVMTASNSAQEGTGDRHFRRLRQNYQ
jgi:hypothetical protein